MLNVRRVGGFHIGGGQVELDGLDTHFPMMDSNSADVAELVLDWLERHTG